MVLSLPSLTGLRNELAMRSSGIVSPRSLCCNDGRHPLQPLPCSEVGPAHQHIIEMWIVCPDDELVEDQRVPDLHSSSCVLTKHTCRGTDHRRRLCRELVRQLTVPHLPLMCEVGNHNRYDVPGLASMAIGQQISSRRHFQQVQLNVESNVAVVDSRISLTCL